MLSGSDFTLRELVEEQCVLFPHCLGENDPYNVILSAMYNQLWVVLQDIANHNGDALPRPFVILGDEWGNLPYVECLGEMVSLGRSMGLHVFVFVQNLTQLDKYNTTGSSGAGVDKLLGSMNLQIAMSVMKANPDGVYFSELCGKRTVLAHSQGSSSRGSAYGPQSNTSESYSEHAVDLLPPASFKDRVPLRDGIIVIKGGENKAPDHEGVFEMPIVDATRIEAVREYFELGSVEEERARCLQMEKMLSERIIKADTNIPCWFCEFDASAASDGFVESVAQDDWSYWDEKR